MPGGHQAAVHRAVRHRVMRVDVHLAVSRRGMRAAVHREVTQGMQRIDYDSGGLIIPLFNPLIDAVAANVKGDIPNVVGQGGLDGFDLRRFWIDD